MGAGKRPLTRAWSLHPSRQRRLAPAPSAWPRQARKDSGTEPATTALRSFLHALLDSKARRALFPDLETVSLCSLSACDPVGCPGARPSHNQGTERVILPGPQGGANKQVTPHGPAATLLPMGRRPCVSPALGLQERSWCGLALGEEWEPTGGLDAGQGPQEAGGCSRYGGPPHVACGTVSV